MTIQATISKLKQGLTGKRAVVFCSGGMDSTVAAILVAMADTDAVFYFIDTGFSRSDDFEIAQRFLYASDIKLKRFNASAEFSRALSGVPEISRRDVLGELLVPIALSIAQREDARTLVFGTIKNDLLVLAEHGAEGIEGFEIVEPLRELTKRQVAKLAAALGISGSFTARPHLPGNGFSVRIAGNITRRKIGLIRSTTTAVEGAFHELNLTKKLWAYFPFLISEKIDGKYAIVIRAVESRDGVSAKPARLSGRQLCQIYDYVTARVPEIGRIFYDLTPKPPANIEFM